MSQPNLASILHLLTRHARSYSQPSMAATHPIHSSSDAHFRSLTSSLHYHLPADDTTPPVQGHSCAPPSLTSCARHREREERRIEIHADSFSNDEYDEHESTTQYSSANTSQESQGADRVDYAEYRNTQIRLPSSLGRPADEPSTSNHAITSLFSAPTRRETEPRRIELHSDSESGWEANEEYWQLQDVSEAGGADVNTQQEDPEEAFRVLSPVTNQIPGQDQDQDDYPFDDSDDDDNDFLLLDEEEEVSRWPAPSQEPLAPASHSLPPTYPLTNVCGYRRDKTPDNDADDFADLVRRTEMKRYHEANPHLVPSPEGVGEEPLLSHVGPPDDTHGEKGKSVRHSEEVALGETRKGSSSAQAFLESLILGLLSDIRNSTVALDDTARNRRKSPDKRERKKRKISDCAEEGERGRNEEATQGSQADSTRQNRRAGVSVTLLNRKTGNDQITSFPDDPLSNSHREPSMTRITCIVVVATVLYEAILTKTVITLRDIFYRDKALFKRQDVVDRLVDDIVATAGLKRKNFFVCASAKGLIASSCLKILRLTGDETVLSPTVATLVDPVERIERLNVTEGHAPKWVLVVEKDAVFQTLCSAGLLEDDRVGKGVMITGKGFPDLATRQMLRLIADMFPNARIHALVDADPHGLAILSTYVYGSRNTAYSVDHAVLGLGDRIEWMGVKMSDLVRLGICHDELLPLEKADVQLATSMLRNQDLSAEWKRELCHMLHLNRKAEIEIVLNAHLATNNGHEHEHEDLFADMFEDMDVDVDVDQDALEQVGQTGHDVRGGLEGTMRERERSKLVEYIVDRMLA